MNNSIINELVNCLQSTLSPDRNERKKAETYIKSIELQPCYSICLLAVVQNQALPLPTRMAAAVTLKNFIKNYWPSSHDETDKISATDRDGVRNQLIGAMLSVSGNVQQQLSEVISTIWREDFPAKWPNLIPELVQRMAQLGADLSMVQGVLYTAHTLFKRYRHEYETQDLFKEMKLVIEQFGAPLTELAKNLFALVVGDNRITDDPNRLLSVFHSLLLVCKIFLSLNCQDLPEFFEDHMADWMSVFRSLLQLDRSILISIENVVLTSSNVPGLAGNVDKHGGLILVEQLKSQICDNISLYAAKYEEEFMPYLPGFVTDVWEMLLSMGDQVKFDMLIGNSIEFLSTVISKPRHRYLFENPETLQKLCEKVILPNMQFRAMDEELFTENPEEYMRLDLEGSNAQTRRRAACHLVHVLCEAFEGPVISNFSTYIEHLLNEYANSPNGSAWASKDAALLLITSVASRGKTQKHGVTISTGLVNLTTFFENHVLSELQHPDVNHLPVIKADCLRYVIAFRTLLPPQALVNLLNLTPVLLSATTPVVHSYAAVLIDKLLAMKRPDSQIEPLIAKGQITNPQLLIERILTVLHMPDSLENVYAIRALIRVCCCLQEQCLPSMTGIVSSLLGRLTQVAKNPCKPDFNHFLFETICLCIRLTCSMDSNSIQHFESALFPIFQEILQQDIVEFVPYVFQLLSVMLEQYPLSQIVYINCASDAQAVDTKSKLRPSQPYSALLPRLLVPSLWDPVKNVPSLVCLIQSYLLHDVEDILSANKLSPILGLFQRLVGTSSSDIYAFTLLTVVIIAIPKDVLMPTFLRQIFMVIFKRLQATKTERFMKCFATFIANFVLVYSPNELIHLIDNIQGNLFARVLEKVLVPYAESIITSPPIVVSQGGSKHLDFNGAPSPAISNQWRQSSIGLIKLIGESEAIVPQVATYHASWAPLVAHIVAGLGAGPLRGGDATSEIAVALSLNSLRNGLGNEERFIEIDSDPSSSTAYSQLIFAIQRFPELCTNIADPRIFLAQTLNNLSSLNPGKISAELNANLENPLAVCLQSFMQRAQLSLN